MSSIKVAHVQAAIMRRQDRTYRSSLGPRHHIGQTLEIESREGRCQRETGPCPCYDLCLPPDTTESLFEGLPKRSPSHTKGD